MMLIRFLFYLVVDLWQSKYFFVKHQNLLHQNFCVLLQKAQLAPICISNDGRIHTAIQLYSNSNKQKITGAMAVCDSCNWSMHHDAQICQMGFFSIDLYIVAKKNLWVLKLNQNVFTTVTMMGPNRQHIESYHKVHNVRESRNKFETDKWMCWIRCSFVSKKNSSKFTVQISNQLNPKCEIRTWCRLIRARYCSIRKVSKLKVFE